MSGILQLLKREIKSEYKKLDLKRFINNPFDGTHNSEHSGYTRLKNNLHGVNIKSLLTRLKDINGYRDVKSILGASIRKDGHLFGELDNLYNEGEDIERINLTTVDDHLEYQILKREGYKKSYLDKIKRIIRILKDESYEPKGAIEKELRAHCQNKYSFGPLYISLVLRRISKENVKTFDDLLCNFLKIYKSEKINDILDLHECRNTTKRSTRFTNVDEQLEKDVEHLLSEIANRGKTGITNTNEQLLCAESPPNYHGIPGMREDFIELQPLENVPVERVDLEGVKYITKLSCANLSQALNCSIEQMRKLCQEIECDEDEMNLEEAEFIMDEMGLKEYNIRIINGRVALERVESEMVRRPLVVTIMGHVDHGKTTLLDRIQKSEIVKTEVGNITQKLGTFQVNMDGGLLTFVDTPGHSAFGVMRSRGVSCADLVLLVIAADDGIMPQTIESINLIKNTNVPCIAVINKVDLVSEDILCIVKDSIKEHLNVPIVHISARSGKNIDALLSEIRNMDKKLNIHTDLKAKAQGYIYETIQHPTRGKCLNVIVRNGTLREGSWITCGAISGKIKKMYDQFGNSIKTAVPSQIVQLAWVQDITNSAGLFIQEAKTQNHAIQIANIYRKKLEIERISDSSVAEVPEINIVLRCGDQGGLEAITAWINEFNKEKNKTADLDYLVERGYISSKNDISKLKSWKPINIVSKRVGPFNQSDSQIVQVGNIAFFGFNITAPSQGMELPPIVRVHDIIYSLFNDIQDMYEFYYGPTYVVKKESTLQVTQLGTITLKGSGKRQVIGTLVKDGTCKQGHYYMLSRDGKVIYRDLIVSSMQSSKRNVTELVKGDSNNAIIFKADIDVRVNDEIIAYTKNNLPPLFNKITQFNLKI